MATFILTWNPANWNWTDLGEMARSTQQGEAVNTDWSTGNTKRIRPDDRLFLLKQGDQPRGIIASGRATSNTYLYPHWDSVRAAKGDQALKVDVEFDSILDPALVSPLSTDGFSGPLGKVYWAPPASGVELTQAAADQLELAWVAHLRRAGRKVREAVGKRQNPHWVRDELILALDLYLKHRPKLPGDTHPEVIALSELLNVLPIHVDSPRGSRCRSSRASHRVGEPACRMIRGSDTPAQSSVPCPPSIT